MNVFLLIPVCTQCLGKHLLLSMVTGCWAALGLLSFSITQASQEEVILVNYSPCCF